MTPTPSERAARVVWDPRRDPAVERAAHAVRARRRGLVQAGIGAAAAAFLAWKVSLLAAAIAGGIAAVVATLALASPLRGLAAVERAIGRFAAWVGTAVAWLLMTPLYYLVLTPLGWFLRARGSLRFRRQPDARVASYWTVLPDAPADPKSYERQF